MYYLGFEAARRLHCLQGMKRKVLSIGAVLSVLGAQCLGFGTGSHYDLTRNVLTEHRFGEVSIEIVQVENWLTDYYSYSPTNDKKRRAVLDRLHFDNLFTDGQVRAYWATLLNNLRTSTERAARENDKMSMLVLLGLGLHAVQDFYSHSNWVELHPQDPRRGFRTETFWSMANSKSVSPPRSLHTGKYPDDLTEGPDSERVSKNAEPHGDHAVGLNKDSPGRPGWDNAYVFAYAASHELVTAMAKWAEAERAGFWDSVREYSVDEKRRTELQRDILAARNMSMWLKAKGVDGTWKGAGSGTQRLFALFSSKWITADTSEFVKAIREGNLQDRLADGLYEKRRAPTFPAVEPFALQRNAVVVRVTHIKQTRNSNALIRLSREGSDYYSRMTIANQEFWGRTIQSMREADDPWHEIFFADARAEEIPLTIAVWDEDSIDPREDEHIDINPGPGSHDLRMIFRVSDDTLSGDLGGIFNSPTRVFQSEGAKPEKDWARIQGYVTVKQVIVPTIYQK